MTQSRRTSRSWPLVVLAGVILALYLAREVMIPFALALTLNFLLTPAVIWLEKLRLGRLVSVIVVLLVSIVALAGIGWVVGNQLLQVASDLPNYRDNIHQRIVAIHGP
jgi:predicted PurR-regulated permease PerM